MDNIFVSTWISNRGALRHIVGRKNEGDTLSFFVNSKAIKYIRQTPFNAEDLMTEYHPVLVSEINLQDTIFRGVETNISGKLDLPKLILYLKDNGYAVYKKHGKKEKNP